MLLNRLSRKLRNLSPPAGRGREPSERVRGTLNEPSISTAPLTPTLSPQAGRGSRPSSQHGRWSNLEVPER